jgi:DNA-binding response OmpR family regulator
VKILLVSSDARVTKQVTTALLGMPDLELVEVRLPEQALTLLDQDTYFDVLIADNDTWPTGGFALSREVKARSAMDKDMPPVVLLLARDQDRWLSDRSGADTYILKPVDPFDLAETVRALVEERPLPALPGVGGDPTPLMQSTGTSQRKIAAGGGGRGEH